MTRDEFIDGYMARSGLSMSHRLPDGFEVEGWRQVAVPCDCGEDICEGWAMLPPDLAHEQLIRMGLGSNAQSAG